MAAFVRSLSQNRSVRLLAFIVQFFHPLGPVRLLGLLFCDFYCSNMHFACLFGFSFSYAANLISNLQQCDLLRSDHLLGQKWESGGSECQRIHSWSPGIAKRVIFLCLPCEFCIIREWRKNVFVLQANGVFAGEFTKCHFVKAVTI